MNKAIKKVKKKFQLKDPGSAITHFIGAVMALFAAIPLLIVAARYDSPLYVIAFSVYLLSLVLLYSASTIYHSLDISKRINTLLKKIDHMMIFVLIAGTYTPICLFVLTPPASIILLAVIWGIAALGILIKAFWVYCPKWISSILYIGMGWACVFAFTQIYQNMSGIAFGLLLGGGIAYTVGGILYAIKFSAFNKRFPKFGSHEIFHLFVLGGSVCHYIMMFAVMPAI